MPKECACRPTRRCRPRPTAPLRRFSRRCRNNSASNWNLRRGRSRSWWSNVRRSLPRIDAGGGLPGLLAPRFGIRWIVVKRALSLLLFLTATACAQDAGRPLSKQRLIDTLDVLKGPAADVLIPQVEQLGVEFPLTP